MHSLTLVKKMESLDFWFLAGFNGMPGLEQRNLHKSGRKQF
jgi:hypothetical protein